MYVHNSNKKLKVYVNVEGLNPSSSFIAKGEEGQL